MSDREVNAADIDNLTLADVIDVEAVQAMMDDFFSFVGIGMTIIDMKGNILVRTGWQEICTSFHRVHPESAKHCVESDTKLVKDIAEGEFRLYRCKNNMWDIATPIIINGKRLGNLFLGQFFFADETVDYEQYRTQARKYGFEEKEYLKALEKVPRWDRTTVYKVMSFYVKLIHMLSSQSCSNIELVRLLSDLDAINAKQKKAEKDLSREAQLRTVLLDNIPSCVAYILKKDTREIIAANKTGRAIGGLPGQTCYRVSGKRDDPCPFCLAQKMWETGQIQRTEVYYLDKWFEGIWAPYSEDLYVHYIFDITERKKTEYDLQYRLQFEKMIANLSSHLVSLPAERLSEGINHVLKLAGQFFEVDRCYIFQFSENGLSRSMTHEWCTKDVETLISKLQDQPLNCLPRWAEIIKSKKMVCITDLQSLLPEFEKEWQIFTSQNLRSVISVPLIKEGKVFGALGFDTIREKKEWTEGHETILSVIAEIISNALSRYSDHQKIYYMTYHDQLTGLYNRRFLEEEMKRLNTGRQLPVSLIMTDLNGLKLINDAYGHNIGDQHLKYAAKILKIACREEDIIARWGGDEFVIILPQTSKKEAKAIAQRVINTASEFFVKEIPISMSLGIAVNESGQMELSEILIDAEDDMYWQKSSKPRSIRSTVLENLLKTLEAKSYETEVHTRRMQKAAQLIGVQISLSDAELNRLNLLITLHDIGKINIPEEVLNKSEDLTEKEWAMIKKHSETGFRIAQATEDFACVAEEILAHHERWDGSGYPRGLSNGQIPLLARIINIADAYEVMSNRRPYKKALAKNEIAAEFKRCAGKQFDPDLIEIFLEILERQSLNE